MANVKMLRWGPTSTYIPLEIGFALGSQGKRNLRKKKVHGQRKKLASPYAKNINMLVFPALGNAKVLSFALGDAKVPNANNFALQWNIGFSCKTMSMHKILLSYIPLQYRWTNRRASYYSCSGTKKRIHSKEPQIMKSHLNVNVFSYFLNFHSISREAECEDAVLVVQGMSMKFECRFLKERMVYNV